MVTVVTKSPFWFAETVPRLEGVECNVRSTVSEAAKPVPESVIEQPAEATQEVVLEESVALCALCASAAATADANKTTPHRTHAPVIIEIRRLIAPPCSVGGQPPSPGNPPPENPRRPESPQPRKPPSPESPRSRKGCRDKTTEPKRSPGKRAMETRRRAMEVSMEPKELFRRIGENLTVGRAFGPSYEVGSTTLIPVAMVAGGGGGGGQGRTGNGAEGPKDAEASGGGFGAFVYPLGAYVVREGNVRFVPSFDLTRLAAGFILFLRLLVKRSKQR